MQIPAHFGDCGQEVTQQSERLTDEFAGVTEQGIFVRRTGKFSPEQGIMRRMERVAPQSVECTWGMLLQQHGFSRLSVHMPIYIIIVLFRQDRIDPKNDVLENLPRQVKRWAKGRRHTGFPARGLMR